MGKDSLLESTSKKTAAAKADKEKPAKKKTAAKKAASTKSTAKGKKSTAAKAKKTTAAKAKKAASAAKTTAKKAAASQKASKTKAKKTAAKTAPGKKAAPTKPSRKELLWKKFDRYPAGALYAPPVKTDATPEAPSFFSGMSAAAAQKAKEYVKRQFDWSAIQAAGEQYAAQMAAKAEEEAKRMAEEEAKRKAEEEAKRKAEEEAKRKAEEEARQQAAAQMPPPTGTESKTGSGFSPIKIGIAAFCAIILILIVSSYSNTKKYYIQEKDGAVEIWRGTFTPMGKTRLMILPGIQMPAEEKEVYAWQDAYRLMYQYYIERADAILEVPGVPDIAALTDNLEKAIQYAPDRELRDAARSRLISLRMQTLVQRAQAALNRGSIESAETAIGFLHEAAQYELSPAEAEMVQRQIEAAEAVLAEREAAQAEAAKAAAAKAALEQEAQTLKEAADNAPPAPAEGGH